MDQEKIGRCRKIMAVACHYCPLCNYGRNHPESIVGKVLHHKLHAEHCPLWKAEKAVYDPQRK